MLAGDSIMEKLITLGVVLAALVLLALPVQARQGTFTIDGTVATADGQGVPGIAIVLSGQQSDTTTTGQNGEFRFTALAAGTYTVAPLDSTYTFVPESHSITFPSPGTPTPVFEASMITATRLEDQQIPTAFDLWPNYPNPFTLETTIRYQVAEAGPVRLDVVDLLGRTVTVLVDEVRSAGVHTATLDARNLPSGLYLYRLQAGTVIRVRRMILAK